MPESPYIQVVPLFAGVHRRQRYFEENRDHLDKMTGADLVVIIPTTVRKGESADIFSDSAGRRFPGLKRADLPCLWVESETNEHFIIGLPVKDEQIDRIFAELTDAVRAKMPFEEIKRIFMEKEKSSRSSSSAPQDPNIRASYLKFAGWSFVAFVAVLLLLQRELPRVRQFSSEALTLSVYGLLGALLAFVAFGIMRSTGVLRGKKWGVFFEFGGPAAMMLAVMFGGAAYESKMRTPAFNLSIYFVGVEPREDRLQGIGKIVVQFRKPETYTIVESHIIIPEISGQLRGQSVDYLVIFDGYEEVDPDATLLLTPSDGSITIKMRRSPVPVIRAEETKTNAVKNTSPAPVSTNSSPTLAASKTNALPMQEKLRTAISLYVGTSNRVDELDARRLFEEAEAGDNPIAMVWAGYLSRVGACAFSKREHANHDEEAAAFTKVAELANTGHEEAQIAHALALRYGVGTTTDDSKAAALFRKSAINGNGLGMMFHGLSFLPNDLDEAKKWLRSATNKNILLAAVKIVQIERSKNPRSSETYKQIEDILRFTADAGCTTAMMELGGLLYEKCLSGGPKFIRCPDLLHEQYAKAAKLGNYHAREGCKRMNIPYD